MTSYNSGYIRNSACALEKYKKYQNANISELVNNLDIEFSYFEMMEIISKIEEKENEQLGDKMTAETFSEALDGQRIMHHTRGETLLWVIFITEYYRSERNLTWTEVNDLFTTHDIYEFLGAYYPALHTQSEHRAVRMIDERINERNE